jgi:precorrin-8X/cobalt-precorrin-8 methylmutase
MPLFDAYLMADWSAAGVPRLGKDSIWIAYGVREGDGFTLLWNDNLPTRHAALERIAETMRDCATSGLRLMAGFDFAFGYPQGTAEQLTGSPRWDAIWAHLADAIIDGPDNGSNRLAVAARLNGRLLPEHGVRFWGNGTKTEHVGLSRTKAGFQAGSISERRVIERHLPGAKTLWQLAGAGAVGSQSLVGIAGLERLRRHPDLAGKIRVWPFETGFAHDLDAPIVITEIYPSLLPITQKQDEPCTDAAQVRTVVETFASLDAEDALEPHLAAPDSLAETDRAAVLSEEGWIVGSTLARAGSTSVARVLPQVASAPIADAPKSADAPSDSQPFDYVRDPDEIYRRSFATIEDESDFSKLPSDLHGIAVRLIHACGMVDLVASIAASNDAATSGRAALRAGAPILCDVEMVRHGIISRSLPAENEVLCLLNDPPVPVLAKTHGTTRSAAQVDLWLPRLDGAIVAIGNAPTALFRLLELIEAGAPKPALIIGMPVGFVGAVESKEALASRPHGVPFIAVHGRRGGSAMASAAVNALALEAGR